MLLLWGMQRNGTAHLSTNSPLLLKACLIIDIWPSSMCRASRYPPLEVKLRHKGPVMLKVQSSPLTLMLMGSLGIRARGSLHESLNQAPQFTDKLEIKYLCHNLQKKPFK